MRVVLNDRTAGLRPELKDYAQKKLERLARHFGRVADAEVDFSEEAKRFGLEMNVVRINVHVDGRRTPVLSAKEHGADPQAALDLALDKIDRQVVKLKERRTSRKQSTSPVRVPPEEPATRPHAAEPERTRMILKPEPLEQVVDQLQADGQAFHVYLDESSGEIQIAYRRADGTIAVIEPVVR
ncbi:MAG TPA: ribosome-associated translation inhibitor RaiA [Candidatus Dormibacteraeota bacterium]|nr:ribosome-associated translation inhibitor RaiA [Candidatus Dormibacteraeota bacterium]